ncbi:MAG TPA: GNAT family N-acetyltransferase [Acidimicrobiales bacterium]
MAASVRAFRANDSQLSDLIALRYQWRTEEAGEKGEGLEGFEARFRSWYDARGESHLGYLLTLDEMPIGCAWLVIIDRIPGPEVFDRRAGMVQSVFLLANYRNQKLGVTLMKALMDEARLMKLSYLMTHPSRESTSFYRRLGFEIADAALELRFELTE